MTDGSDGPVGDGGVTRRPMASSPALVRLTAAAVGGLALIAGAVGSFVLRSDAGAVAVLAAGTALLIVALLLPRLSELDVGTDGISLKLTQDVAKSGAPTAATVMQNSGLSRFAIAYEIVNSELQGELDYELARTHLQDVLVERARSMAFGSKIPASEVRALFVEGSPVMRTLGIGIMKGDPSTADIGLLTSAVVAPGSANEQFHALAVIEQLWSRWTRDEREYLQGRIRSTDFPPGTDRSARGTRPRPARGAPAAPALNRARRHARHSGRSRSLQRRSAQLSRCRRC